MEGCLVVSAYFTVGFFVCAACGGKLEKGACGIKSAPQKAALQCLPAGGGAVTELVLCIPRFHVLSSIKHASQYLKKDQASTKHAHTP